MSSSTIRKVLIIGSSAIKSQLGHHHQHQQLNGFNLQLQRAFSRKVLTPSISFLTNSEHSPFMKKSNTPTINSLKNKGPTLAEFRNEESRPLSILLCWLMSKPNAIKKYAQFYLDQGFDVLTVRISPWELLWPASYNPIVQHQLLPILTSSNHEKKLIHGFSVGGYVFSQLLKHYQQTPDKYQPLMDSIQGQIWDSVVDVNGVAVGVSKSVFVNNEFLQQSLQSYIELHMKLFYSVATKYYEEAHEHFYYKPLKAPSLFLASKIDPISTIDVITELKRIWGSTGIDCTARVWDNTNHVGHYHKHPEEYKAVVQDFLRRIDWKSSGRNKTEVVEDEERIVRPAPAHAPSFA